MLTDPAGQHRAGEQPAAKDGFVEADASAFFGDFFECEIDAGLISITGNRPGHGERDKEHPG